MQEYLLKLLLCTFTVSSLKFPKKGEKKTILSHLPLEAMQICAGFCAENSTTN